MAVKTKEEILGLIKDKFGEDTSDEALSFVEDITDTLNDYESRTADQTNWKNKFEENDASWRQKYRDRFFQATDDRDDEPEYDDAPKTYSYEDLFKTER